MFHNLQEFWIPFGVTKKFDVLEKMGTSLLREHWNFVKLDGFWHEKMIHLQTSWMLWIFGGGQPGTKCILYPSAGQKKNNP